MTRNIKKLKHTRNVRGDDDDDGEEDTDSHPAAALTVEVNGADVGQQFFAVDVGHARTQPRVPGAELAVHVVQSVGHGVHGVHHELHLPLLLIAGVAADFLQPWKRNKEVSGL